MFEDTRLSGVGADEQVVGYNVNSPVHVLGTWLFSQDLTHTQPSGRSKSQTKRSAGAHTSATDAQEHRSRSQTRKSVGSHNSASDARQTFVISLVYTNSLLTNDSIDNPFLTFNDTRYDPESERTELEEYVWQFALQADLEDRYEILRFGARLARDKHEAMTRYADEITTREKILLQTEKDKATGFWKQSKLFRATIVTASLAGMIQGWTQSANNGTAYGMPEDLGVCYRTGSECSVRKLWTFGMLNAIPLFSAGLFGTILADPLQENVLGRRGSVMLSCAITIATTIGASVTTTVGQLAACRALNGIALGAKASIG